MSILTRVRLLILCFMTGLLLTPAGGALAQAPTSVPVGPTLKSVLSRGELNCGVNQDLFGFGYLDPNTGEVGGFDVDFCRAVAAAVFGDATAVQFALYTDIQQGLDALRARDIDLLMHNAVWTLSGESGDLTFAPVNFFSGQGILVRADSTAKTWQDLNNATICVLDGGIAQSRLPITLAAEGAQAQLLALPDLDSARRALNEDRCDALSADQVLLEVLRQRASSDAGYRVWEAKEYVYTNEPYAPVVRSDDPQWTKIVRWTVLGLIEAEQLGLTSENIGQRLRAADGSENDAAYNLRVGPAVARFVDPSLGISGQLGLAPNFMVAVIQQVGNYGEIYNRSLGPDSMLPIPRQLNALAEDGGLQYAPDWR